MRFVSLICRRNAALATGLLSILMVDMLNLSATDTIGYKNSGKLEAFGRIFRLNVYVSFEFPSNGFGNIEFVW